MNLASQTVLEGLNACLDHRGEVYIAELDQVFKRHPDFKLFAAQNPHHQGGGRKGLPSSFVNRFIVVYSDVFTKQDLLHITAKKFSTIGGETQQRLIEFMSRLDDEVVSRRSFGALGSPWEFNLRDTLRWGDLLTSQNALLAGRKPDDYLDVIIRQRFRTERDRTQVNKLFAEIFERPAENHGLYHDINPYLGQVGLASLKRNPLWQPTTFPAINPVPRLKEIESIMLSIEQDLPCILVGPSGSGKSALLAHVAALAGKSLVIFPLNADVDAMDLIGGFEQADPHREVQACLSKLRQALQEQILLALPNPVPNAVVDLMAALNALTGEVDQYESILPLIEALRVDVSIPEDLTTFLFKASDALSKPLTLENPRFEWLDGVIVRAVETGAWLVLDNANLCSASVLDRLNSLLERPNGILSINEHSGPGGEPRIIKPHPDFRIFLTVDPRYGELSRAMRNRSIEIYLDVLPADTVAVERIAPVDGSLQRFHAAASILDQQGENGQLVPLAFDVLSLGDSNKLDGYLQASREALANSSPSLIRSPAAVQHLGQVLSYIQAEDAGPLRQSLANLYTASPDKMLMPLHALINSPMVSLLEQGHEGLAFWLASCYEFYISIQTSEKAMEAQLSKVNVSKPSSMNRLQRSWVADKVASLSRDSTVNAVRFLSAVLRAVKAFLCEKSDEPGAWKQRRSVLRRLMLFWKRTFESLIVPSFEEARFQAHLTQGSNLLQHSMSALQEAGDHKLLSTLSGVLERDFVVGFKLSSGLSMEVLWHQLRPDPIPDAQTLEQVMELERLADRFDSLRWRVDVNISTLRTIQDSMARVYALIRTGKGDAASLVKDLQSEITALEARIGEHSTTHQPFFASSFEGLRQALVLHQVSQDATMQLGSSDVDVLASIPTPSLMRLQCLKQTALQAVDYILVQDSSEVHPWEGALSKSLLLKYDAASSASLDELRSLEVEMPIMGRALVAASEALATDPLVKVERLLLKLMEEVVAAHDQSCRGQLTAVYEGLLARDDIQTVPAAELGPWLEQASALAVTGEQIPQHLSVVFQRHFSKALLALAASAKGFQPRSASTSAAWIRFALGCVELFVPDKIFDPHHRAQVEAEEHQELYQSLQSQIAALEAFELAFTGQKTSLRSQLMVEEAEGLGEPPSVQQIYRPGGGELRSLQGEFNNVLNALIGNDVAATHLRSLVSSSSGDAAEELALVEQNVTLLIARLTSRFGAYQDLTMPLVSFLRCVRMGLSLGRGVGSSKAAEEGDTQALVTVTPFLSGTVWNAESTSLPIRILEFLSFVQTVVAVEGLDKLPISLRQSLHESLGSFHEEWTKKLEADRKIEEANTSLFRFKGSLEDQEEYDQEEFSQLFPDYTPDEDGMPKNKRPSRGGRDLSVMLAEAHGKIFLSAQEPQQSIKALCAQVARRVAREKRDSAVAEPELDSLLLPATILAFDEQVKAFSSNVGNADYNFYTDANLAEVRKILGLVNSLKTRFLELQAVDEIGHHQTLADVVMACDKVLEMAIDDPLASIITAIERLHAHVYEWHEGGWASKVHKATVLYEKLRDTICDWRRLELSSWSRLLDAEVKKSYEDAKSWWFIAYGAVILEPCSILQQGLDLKDHAVKLLSTLDSYFTGASFGQFGARLDLLRQLKNQLDQLVLDEPALGLICDAVQNFITFYSRYERKVGETIKAGRTPLDRSMKDVLLLSKWRDKNIESLRDSARRSHQKLFKLVRKFRAVLEQPVKPMMDQGLPEEDHSSSAVSVDGVKLVEAQADQSAIVLCQQALPDIASHPHWTRMSNLPAVLKAMSKHGSLPTTIVDAAETVDSYITDLASSIAALKKETPGTLTDENKELVRHLKTRKVTLYSDTLKTLRAMGFSRNLGTNLLEKQSSTAVVLVGSGVVPHVDGVVLSAIEYFYHKTLDLAPRFRHATYEHSDDLNREVVQRSIGYLEGVLHVMFRQRQFLARAAGDERGLHGAVETIKDLSVGGDESFRPQARSANHAQVVRWLVQILKAGIHLVEVHGKLGGADNAGVRGSLVGWAETFAKLDAAHDRLPRLPDGFSSSGGDKLQGDVERELDALRVGLAEIAQARPDLAFVVRQIQLWTSIQATEVINGISGDDIDNFAAAALTLSSKILVALQNFQKVAQTLPVTTEDAGWFLNYSDNLQKSVDALRMAKITSEVKSLIHQLKSLPADQSPTASALLRLIHPVLSQYSTICTQNLTQFASLHRTTSRLGYHLAASFVQISSQGFCTPEEKSDEKSGESGNVESGTGLGDGEGAEDISKDIKADEDLSDLAQDPNNKTQGDIEENQDAVDMGDDELEGEMGSVAGEDEDEEKKDGDKDGEDEEEDEMDEQAGDVDDLDPTAVDEKMWDGSGEEEAEKDQMGDQEKGKKDDDQSAAAEGEKKEQQKGEEQEDGNAPPDEVGEEQGDEDAEMEAGQEEEGVAQEELNRQDQNVQENETLALPEDMDIEIDDGEEESGDDDDLDGLSDAEKPEEKQADAPDDMSQSGDEEKGEEEHQKDEDVAEEEAEQEEEIDAAGDREEEMEVDAEEEGQGEEGQDEEKDEKKPPLPDDGTGADQDDVAPSDVQNGGGQAEDANMQDDEVENKAGQKEQGALGKQSAEEDKAPGSKGALSSMDQEQGPSDETEDADSKDAQPFKKLGDALDRWYRNQREIQAASDSQEKTEQSAEDMARAEFQHLQDETAEADTQALGTATNEEARPMDDAMAVDTEMDEGNNQIMPEDEQEEEGGDVEMEDIEPAEPQDASKNDREEGRSGVATRKGAYETDDKDEIPQAEAPEDVDDEEIDDTSSQLLATHITEEDEDATPLRDYTEALDMWSGFQTKTQALSQSLSSQLRLILTPTQSTKLSGSFRTGKRLNIKKIIPYIASSYKRDKIWMRRAIPSKRAYQILLCVDDSSSMSDDNRSSSGNLALESLVMVTRALTVLEAGQIGVLGFGTDVFVAHALTDPSFTSQDTGAHVLQKFTFRQEGTDMVRLLRKTIDHFREARVMQASGAGSEDLWQLALILSDGLVQSRDHARLRPLLREAMEQRVMVVFIVMDDARENKKGHSVLELKEARFGPDGVPVIHRYLDSFPFPYYLIVHHLEDLPGALAALLRTWFAEVNS
jgi:midasin